MSQTDEAWSRVAEQLRALGLTIRDHYDAQADQVPEESVSRGEVEEAIKTLGDSLSAAAGAAGVAFRDPEVTKEVKATAASFFTALGTTFSEFGSGIATGGHDDPSNGRTDPSTDDVTSHHSEEE